MKAPVFSETEIDVSQQDFSDKIALIDADFFKYLVTSSIYKKIMDEGETNGISTLNETVDYYLSREIFDRFKAKAYLFCFSAPSHKVFRNHVAQEKEYKGNRKNQNDTTYYPSKYDDMAYVFDYVSKRYPTLIFDDLEADDIVSFLQDPENTFIVSRDKDLKQVTGHHYNSNKNTLEFTTEDEGLKMLLGQTLIGDTTDNFGGLYRFGPKKLEALLQESPNTTAELLFYKTIRLYTEHHGLLKGIDTFVEMWSIASMKLDRGNYFKEKYSKAYALKQALLE